MYIPKTNIFIKNTIGKMYKLMSQNLLKRAITNKPKVEKFILSKYHIFLLKEKFNFSRILAMKLQY